jgi:hypothetical protein
MIRSRIYVARSIIDRRGFGVFTESRINNNALVMRCPVVIVQNPGDFIKNVFEWDAGGYAMVLGLGSLLNHSLLPNLVAYCDDAPIPHIAFCATRNISSGTELTINYGGDVGANYTPTWK